jgi:hypothetical protein
MDYPEQAVMAVQTVVGEEMGIREGGHLFTGRVTQCQVDGWTIMPDGGEVVAFLVWLQTGRPSIRGPFRVSCLPVGPEETKLGTTTAILAGPNKKDRGRGQAMALYEQNEAMQKRDNEEARGPKWAKSPGPWRTIPLPMMPCDAPSCPTNAR